MIQKIKIWIIVVGAWLAIAGQALAAVHHSDLIDDLVEEANTLFSQYKDREALDKFRLVLTEDPNHYEALYKISMLNSRIGARYSDETDKTKYFTIAKEYAEKAVQADPQGADGHYVMALAINNLSIVTGAKDRIVNLKFVKQHLDKALAANPEHAAAWQLMGRWQYRVAHINFLEATVSKFLTGGVPVGASNYKAIEALKKSIQYDPQNISSYYDLAIIYRDMENRTDSIFILEQARKLNLVTSEDLEISRRCKTLLQELGAPSLI